MIIATSSFFELISTTEYKVVYFVSFHGIQNEANTTVLPKNFILTLKSAVLLVRSPIIFCRMTDLTLYTTFFLCLVHAF